MQQVDKLLRKRMRSAQTKQVREIQQSVSAQRDHVNPQRAGHLRAAHAEEALIAYVINNPDMAKNIKEQMPPDAMVTDFNRRVYQLILGRIQEGRPADLMDLSQDFSMEEMGRITQILASAPPAVSYTHLPLRQGSDWRPDQACRRAGKEKAALSS